MSYIQAWLEQVSLASPLGFAVMALAGLVMGIAPSSYPLATVVAGCVGGQTRGEQKAWLSSRGLVLSAGFVLGIATVDAVIGVLVGFLGFAIIRALAGSLAVTNLALGLLLIVLGLALLRKIRFFTPVLSPRPHRVQSFAAAYALGVPFGLSVCPACTPMVLPVLGAAALSGTPWLGGALLLVFGIARGAPLLLVGAAAERLKDLPRVMMLAPAVERVSGVLLLLAALYFLYQSAVYAGFLPPLGVLGTP
ncbi:cytochrome c biogenesis protein transmembrane region [Hyphomicrobium denitrificans 1NES1]|uniref:Cytochrome c biogenesis protein transmembrane region n=1 Tax=Hyphomicrobium denitrificans 1NES1 TaxID=670307 RepID=N0B9C5_9HYPH|nr:sulfite exporter TauE/SafE family protein [Hyphomicrobium denitrificans]AGK57126.1 cytochrome c biogenesis protein transmembrane region [Hyphomicrobium denitrificans 1NES1]